MGETTYKRGNSIYGHFSPQRQKEMEAIGRDNAKLYFEQLGAVVSANDVDENGKLDYNKPDLKAITKKSCIFIEAATKGDDIWKYIYQGVDVEKRKLKYGDMLLFMSKKDGTEAVIIPGKCLRLAQDSCGEEYFGQGVTTSENFVMPEHRCHRVRKRCRQPNGNYAVEDFYRIPYEYVLHLKKENGRYKVKKEGQPIK